MRLAFYHGYQNSTEPPEARRIAEIMVRSAKETMPGLEVVQLTDMLTKPIKGVDAVISKPMDYPWLMQFRLDHFKELQGETILCDTDVTFQRDMRHVFDAPFDVALTKRTQPIMHQGRDIIGDMPYNCGVMFSRSPAFWDAVYKRSALMTDALKNWMGDQAAIKEVAARGKFKVLELACDEYNYSPSEVDEDLTSRYAVHWKGPTRKTWLLARELEDA